MKIEFCCEEMEKRYTRGRLGEKWYWYEITIGGAKPSTCPYCGAKIEITVKDNRPKYLPPCPPIVK